MPFEFNFTKEKLAAVIPHAHGVDDWFATLSDMLPQFEITSVKRAAAFLAQTYHESIGYTDVDENLGYSAEALMKFFGKHFASLEEAQQYAHHSEKIANRIYANRMGNGDETSGDGYKFRGRGLIQITGKEEYVKFATFVNMPVEEVTTYMETKKGAVHSACWFWSHDMLNTCADRGDLKTMTKRINGGYIGLEDRIQQYNRILPILSQS